MRIVEGLPYSKNQNSGCRRYMDADGRQRDSWLRDKGQFITPSSSISTFCASSATLTPTGQHEEDQLEPALTEGEDPALREAEFLQ